ncbi:MAG: class I SAM-dependent methyltransferase [Thaumarchaeota archaeon]|nr:class I SAM-dependent methyltransferase [Nitrososphaerota archaeon]MBI3641337.1 class I SAM-dependent methyltransferase [Nitrososphaerota archaeon]
MKDKVCILCKYQKLHLIAPRARDSVKHKIMKCDKCGHVQLSPIPTLDDDKKFYDENLQDENINYHGSIDENRKKSTDDTIRRFELIRKLAPKNGKILEIGSGHGFFLELMRQKGYDITGIEISKEKRRISKKVTSAKVLDIDINTQIPHINDFDVMVMFHVLEHIINPIDFLKKIRNLLVSNGKIIVEVPNYNDFQLKLNKYYREFYWQRAHIHYFTPQVLDEIFDQAGLRSKIIGIQRYSIENMFSWKLTNKPQMSNPLFNLTNEYEWIEKPYKKHLEKNLISDTIVVIGDLKK